MRQARREAGEIGLLARAGVHHQVARGLAHDGRAEEHFLPAGPFAILPLPGNRSSLVLDGETGFVLDANPEAFETALVQLASDPARIARMGRAARQRAVALGIDDRTVTDRFLEAYGLARQPGPG